MSRTYALLVVFAFIATGCVTTGAPPHQEPLDASAFPVTFTAAGLAGTKQRFIKAGATSKFEVAYVGIWTNDQADNRAYIQTYHYHKDTYGNTRPDFEEYLQEFDPALRNKQLAFGPVQLFVGHDGNIYYQTFSFENTSCVAFFEHVVLRKTTPPDVPGDGEVNGYYCAPRGEKLVSADIRDFLSSLRHRDARKRPDKVS